jgi:hypothetical protein
MWLVQNARPDIPFGFDITDSFFTASFALNIFVSVGLIIRLLVFRSKIMSSLGWRRMNGLQYIHIANMLIEAAIPYTLISIACLLTSVTRSPLRFLFNQPFGSVQVSYEVCHATLLFLQSFSDHIYSDDYLQGGRRDSLVAYYNVRFVDNASGVDGSRT